MNVIKIILINVATIFVATLIPLVISIVKTLTSINVKKCKDYKEAKDKLLDLIRQDIWIEYWLRFIDIRVKANNHILSKPFAFILVVQESIAKLIAIPIIRKRREITNE